ncbi:MDR family MFS transporter [Gryllotalpicola koreensis]|uniref:MDR family MFS transporter n=1 Tax=Gryllotalpicola koreensis TaxID=993086 RepID=A0ABP8A8V6_9MICO
MTTPSTEPVSSRRLNLLSVVLVLGAITSLLDTTIVNIALDHLHASFHASVAQTQWISTGYLLAYVSVIPVSGWVSERFGARNAWMFAIATFLVGSLLCGLSGSLPLLVAFRVLQGIGAGMILPVTITILTRAAGHARIGHAMMAIALPGQLAPILGPVIGGAILDSLNWHWLFFVNVPICVVALVLGPVFLAKDLGRREHRFDLAGFAMLTPGVIAIAYGVSEAAGAHGFAAIGAWLPLVLGAVLLVAFVFYALRVRTPALIDVRVFARRSFGLSSVITFVGGFSTFALMFLLPLFYQQIRGETVLHTGLLLIPQGLGTMFFLVLSRRFLANVDGRIVVGGGVLLTMIGIVPFALAGASGGEAVLLAAQFLQGIGLGAVSLPVMALAFSSLSPAETPRGSAAFSVVQRVGAPFGVAVIAVILQGRLSHAVTPALALGAFGGTFWWIFGLSAIPLLLALFIPRRRATAAVPTEERPAEVSSAA